jgi:hypothetical protein
MLHSQLTPIPGTLDTRDENRNLVMLIVWIVLIRHRILTRAQRLQLIATNHEQVRKTYVRQAFEVLVIAVVCDL